MKFRILSVCYIVVSFISISNIYAVGQGVYFEGKVKSKVGCVQPSQLFVSNEKKELLYQVEVPVNGSFSFALKKGNYIFHAANKEGCVSEDLAVNIPKMKNITLNLIRQKAEKK